MNFRKRAAEWLLTKVILTLGEGRFSRLPSEHPRIFKLIVKVSGYAKDQPARYDLSGKQFGRAVDLRNLAVRHFNALAEEGAPKDRLQRVQRIYQLADEELNVAIEADRLNFELEISDLKDASGEERGLRGCPHAVEGHY